MRLPTPSTGLTYVGVFPGNGIGSKTVAIATGDPSSLPGRCFSLSHAANAAGSCSAAASKTSTTSPA